VLVLSYRPSTFIAFPGGNKSYVEVHSIQEGMVTAGDITSYHGKYYNNKYLTPTIERLCRHTTNDFIYVKDVLKIKTVHITNNFIVNPISVKTTSYQHNKISVSILYNKDVARGTWGQEKVYTINKKWKVYRKLYSKP